MALMVGFEGLGLEGSEFAGFAGLEFRVSGLGFRAWQAQGLGLLRFRPELSGGFVGKGASGLALGKLQGDTAPFKTL